MRPEHKEFSEWRRREGDKIPELAARIFAVRGTGYSGSGFHWWLMCELGTMMSWLHNYDDHTWYHGETAFFKQIALEVRLKMLYERVDEIEQELKEKAKT